MFHNLSLELDMKRRARELDQSQDDANLSPGNVQIPYHSTHRQPYSLEEAAATAASIKYSDPSIYEVANAVPHAVVTRGNAEATTEMYSGMYRGQSQVVQQDQCQVTGGSLQDSSAQGKHFVDYPHQVSDNSAAHNSHQAPPQSNIAPPFPTSASSNSASAQQSNSATKPASVPCPLDSSSGSPGNASGHGTGRTLQAQKESSIMKQDMKSQKEFQNKMRALKQVELNKYGGRENPTDELNAAHQGHQYDHEGLAHPAYAPAWEGPCDEPGQATHDHSASHTPLLQEHDGIDQDFWDSGEVNDQLFDFLMDSH
jgi:hypothetical protein